MPELRASVGRELSRQLGEHVDVITAASPLRRQVRGLAVCAGRVISYVFDGRTNSLRVRNLYELSALVQAGT
jgi:hypothetical protein